MAKHISSELKIPTSELNSDSSAFMSLRIWGQLIKEALSRQASGIEVSTEAQQAVTLVMRNNQVYRKNINLTPEEFFEMVKPLDDAFQELVTRAIENMEIEEDNIGRVILIGGGILLPGIAEGISDRFGVEKIVVPETPEEIMVRGIGLSFMSSLPEREAQERKHIPERKTGWRLIHEDGNVIDIQNEIVIVGRSSEADITLDSKKCSRTHALIRLEGNVLTLIDLRSKNGTYVNQTQLGPHTPHYLRAGDQLLFGDQAFNLE
jgi:molecular chaperone DnaK (HSP70)